MKKTAVLLLFAAMCATATARQGQLPTWGDLPRNGIGFSPLSPFLATPVLSCERHISDQWAVEVHAAVQLTRQQSRPDGASLALDARWYFYYSHPLLLFVEGGVYGAYGWMTRDVFTGNDGFEIHTARHTYSACTIRPSLMGGMRLQSAMGLFLEMRLGFNPGTDGVYNSDKAIINSLVTASSLGTYVGVKIGYAF